MLQVNIHSLAPVQSYAQLCLPGITDVSIACIFLQCKPACAIAYAAAVQLAKYLHTALMRHVMSSHVKLWQACQARL